jgi:hypothetical protein
MTKGLLKVSYNNSINRHEPLQQTVSTRCAGKNREQIQLRVKAEGITNIITQNKLNETGPINPQILANIASEFNRRFRYSSDIFIDIGAAKDVLENLKLSYISEIGLNPYGFLLMSEFQVKFCLCFL